MIGERADVAGDHEHVALGQVEREVTVEVGDRDDARHRPRRRSQISSAPASRVASKSAVGTGLTPGEVAPASR